MRRIIKECSCCGMEFDFKNWQELEFVGVQVLDNGHLVLRNCLCGSTISIAFDEKGKIERASNDTK